MKVYRDEKELQNDCIKYLKSLDDCWFFKTVGSSTQAGGIPDLIICYKGQFVGAELKVGNKYKATGRQELVMKYINRAHGKAGVVKSIDDLNELLGIK